MLHPLPDDGEQRWRHFAPVLHRLMAVLSSGWSTIVTQNMEGNDAILASNLTLRFVPTLGKRDLALDYT